MTGAKIFEILTGRRIDTRIATEEDDSMHTSSGLDVPRLGEGGRTGHFKNRRESRRDPRRTRAWVEAQHARPGDCLIGGKSGDIYAVLHTDTRDDGQVDLTVHHTPTDGIRHWVRTPTFQLERA